MEFSPLVWNPTLKTQWKSGAWVSHCKRVTAGDCAQRCGKETLPYSSLASPRQGEQPSLPRHHLLYLLHTVGLESSPLEYILNSDGWHLVGLVCITGLLMSLEIYLILIKIFNQVLIQLLAWKVCVLHINGYMFLHIQMPSGELWEIELACLKVGNFPTLWRATGSWHVLKEMTFRERKFGWMRWKWFRVSDDHLLVKAVGCYGTSSAQPP